MIIDIEKLRKSHAAAGGLTDCKVTTIESDPYRSRVVTSGCLIVAECNGAGKEEEAAFIALAHNTFPILLDELETLRNSEASLRDELTTLEGAAKAVRDAWESGDLAGAVRWMASLLDAEPDTRRAQPSDRDLREIARAAVNGELSTSRVVELVNIWMAGNFTPDQLPAVRQLPAVPGKSFDDVSPWDVIEHQQGREQKLRTYAWELVSSVFNKTVKAVQYDALNLEAVLKE